MTALKLLLLLYLAFIISAQEPVYSLVSRRYPALTVRSLGKGLGETMKEKVTMTTTTTMRTTTTLNSTTNNKRFMELLALMVF